MAEQIKINVPLSELKSIVCYKCGNEHFAQAGQLKIVPSIYSPSGKEEVIMIQSGFLCVSCGTPAQMQPPKEEDTPSNLIKLPNIKDN